MILPIHNTKDTFFSFLTGKTNKEIEEKLLELQEKAIKGQSKSEELLIDLEKRYQQDKEKITAILKGAHTNTMSTEEKLTEYGLVIREQLRTREEAKFESAALSVGIAERLKTQLQRCDSLNTSESVRSCANAKCKQQFDLALKICICRGKQDNMCYIVESHTFCLNLSFKIGEAWCNSVRTFDNGCVNAYAK